MNRDPLSDVLSSVRLRGSVFYYVSFGDDWAAETPASRQLANALMPGAEHVLAYHLIARGSGWAATAGEPPVRLNSGDIVMFPRGDSHVLSSAPGLRATITRSACSTVARTFAVRSAARFRASSTALTGSPTRRSA